VAPAAANADLSVVLEDMPPAFPGSAKEPPPPGIVVPLIKLGARWLASWATLVTGDTDQAYHGRAIFTGQLEVRLPRRLGVPRARRSPRRGGRVLGDLHFGAVGAA
jgi:hypothetical protein